jgi:hypothetical protein
MFKSFDLQAMRIVENRRNLKVTILHRPGGEWTSLEIGRLVNGLMTELSQHPRFPEHLLLFGHYTKEQTLEALIGGLAYTATQITGYDNSELPFKPSWVA